MNFFRGRRGLISFILWAYVHTVFAGAFASQNDQDPDWILKIIPPSQRLSSQSSLSEQSGATRDTSLSFPKLELNAPKVSKKTQTLGPSSRKIIMTTLGSVSWTSDGTLTLRKSPNTPSQCIYLEGGALIKNLVVRGHQIFAKGPSVYESVWIEDGGFVIPPKEGGVSLNRYRHLNSTLENQGHFSLLEAGHFTKGSVINKDQWQGCPAKLSGTLELWENGGSMTYALSKEGLAVKEIQNRQPGTLIATETISDQGPLTIENGSNFGDIHSTPHPVMVTDTFNNHGKWGVKRLEGIGRVYNFNSLKHLERVNLASLSNGVYQEGKQALIEFSLDKDASIILDHFYNNEKGLIQSKNGLTFHFKRLDQALNKGGLTAKSLAFYGPMPLKNQGTLNTESLHLNDVHLLKNEQGGSVEVALSTIINFKDKNEFLNQGEMRLSGVYPQKWVDVWHYSGQDPKSPFIRSSFEGLLRKESGKILPFLPDGSLKEAYETFLEKNKAAPVTGKSFGLEAVFLLRAFQVYRQGPTPALEKALVDWIISGHGCGGLNDTETLNQDELLLYEDILTTLLINAKYYGRVHDPIPQYPSYYRKSLWEGVKARVDQQPRFNWLNDGYVINAGDLTLKNTRLLLPFGVFNDAYSKEEAKGILRLENTTLDHVHNTGALLLEGEGPLQVLLGEKRESDFPRNTIHWLDQEEDAFIQAKEGAHHIKDSDGNGVLELLAQGTLLSPKTFFKAFSRIKSTHPFTWEIGDFGEGDNHFTTHLSKIILQNTNPITFKTPRFFIPAGLTLKLLEAPCVIDTHHFACLGELEVLLLKLFAKTGQMGRAPSGRAIHNPRFSNPQNQAIMGKITSYGATDIEIEEAFHHEWGVTESKGPLTITSKTNAIHIGDSIPGGFYDVNLNQHCNPQFGRGSNGSYVYSAEDLSLKTPKTINNKFGGIISKGKGTLEALEGIENLSGLIQIKKDLLLKSPVFKSIRSPFHRTVEEQKHVRKSGPWWNRDRYEWTEYIPIDHHTGPIPIVRAGGTLTFETPTQIHVVENHGGHMVAEGTIKNTHGECVTKDNPSYFKQIIVQGVRSHPRHPVLSSSEQIDLQFQQYELNQAFINAVEDCLIKGQNCKAQGGRGEIRAITSTRCNPSDMLSLYPQLSIDDNIHYVYSEAFTSPNPLFFDYPGPNTQTMQALTRPQRTLVSNDILSSMLSIWSTVHIKRGDLFPGKSPQEQLMILWNNFKKLQALKGNKPVTDQEAVDYPYFMVETKEINGQPVVNPLVIIPAAFQKKNNLSHDMVIESIKKNVQITMKNTFEDEGINARALNGNLDIHSKKRVGTLKKWQTTHQDGNKTITQDHFGPQSKYEGKKITDIAEESFYHVAPHYEVTNPNSGPIKVGCKKSKMIIKGEIGYQEETETSRKETPFSSSEQTTYTKKPSQIKRPIFKGNLEIIGEEAELEGVDLQGPIIKDSTKKGVKFTPLVGEIVQQQRQTTNNTFGSTDAGSRMTQEFMVQPKISTLVIYRPLQEGKMVFESVDWCGRTPKIIGNYEETERVLRSSFNSWCQSDQVLGGAALPILALAITIGTQGWGGSFAGTLLGAVGTTKTVIAAGFSSLCARGGVDFLQHGDMIKTAKNLFSDKGVKILLQDMATAGVLDKVKGAFNVNLTPKTTAFMDHLKAQGIKAGVNHGMKMIIQGESLADAFEKGVKETLLNSVSGVLSAHIGQAYRADEINGLVHKTSHAVIGGLSGFIYQGNSDGLGAGALGAVAAELAAEALMPSKEDLKKEKMALFKAELEKGNHDLNSIKQAVAQKLESRYEPELNLAKLIGTTAGAFFGNEGVEVAQHTAFTAIENNSISFLRIALTPAQIQAIAQGLGLTFIAATGEFIDKITDKIADGICKPFLKKAPGEENGQTTTQPKAISGSGGMDPDQDPNNDKKVDPKNRAHHEKYKNDLKKQEEFYNKQVNSNAQMKEEGTIIAGGNSGSVFKDVQRVVKTYGGNAADWVKKSSSAYSKKGVQFETHWIENLKTGKRIEFKTNFPKPGK